MPIALTSYELPMNGEPPRGRAHPPAMRSSARAIAKALSISLGVHAALIAMLWQVASSPRQSTPRTLRVELSATASQTRAVASANVSAAQKQDSTEHKIDEHDSSERPPRKVRAQTSVAPVVHAPVAAQDARASSAAGEADATLETAAEKPQQGVLPIDLRVVDWLARYRTYPLAARRERIEGVVRLSVTLLPDGRLVDARVEHSSGHRLLDEAALELLSRAAPLPSEFGGARTEQIQLQLPIVYRMRASST